MGNLEIQMMNLPEVDRRRPPEGNLKRVQTKLLAEEKDAARSVVYFENCQKRQPDDPECLLGLGLTQLRMGALDRSVQNLSRASSLSPQDGEILRELAAAHFLKGNLPEAKKYVEQAAVLLPSDAKVQFYLGRVYFEEKRMDEAVQAYLKANKLEPNWAENYYHLGMAYGAKGMMGPAYRSLGYYYKLNGDRKTALVQFQKALPLFGDASSERASVQKEIQELTPTKQGPDWNRSKKPGRLLHLF
jgi:tetratricopeptide (TPR) repeat protein